MLLQARNKATAEAALKGQDLMNASSRWSRALLVSGLVAMLIGAIDPLEGSLVILLGSVLAVVGALLGKSRHRRLVYWASSLIAAGVGAMFVLSMLGGTGGSSGRSNWWLLVVVPYPVGWIMGLVGVILSLRERRFSQVRTNAAVQQ